MSARKAHVGLLDASFLEDISRMKPYRGSQIWGNKAPWTVVNKSLVLVSSSKLSEQTEDEGRARGNIAKIQANRFSDSAFSLSILECLHC